MTRLVHFKNINRFAAQRQLKPMTIAQQVVSKTHFQRVKEEVWFHVFHLG